MPYGSHARAVARFNLGPGTAELETASCSLNFYDVIVLNSNPLTRQAAANACFESWSTFIQNGDAWFSTAVRLMEVRYYVINEQGRADHPPSISTQDPVKGSAAVNLHPYQVSNVVTLVASPGGKGRFGRIYLPPQSFQVTDNGLTNPGQVTGMSNAAFDFLDDISDKPGLDGSWKLIIAGTTGPEGTLREVEEVRFGRVADTQRRRRRSLEESYVVRDFDA